MRLKEWRFVVAVISIGDARANSMFEAGRKNGAGRLPDEPFAGRKHHRTNYLWIEVCEQTWNGVYAIGPLRPISERHLFSLRRIDRCVHGCRVWCWLALCWE